MSESALLELQTRFAATIRDPSQPAGEIGVPERRMAVYQDLFFNNISEGLGSVFPVARQVIEADIWEGLVRAFWREHRSHTPEYPRMAGEFLVWLDDNPVRLEGLPPWLFELLIWEHAELDAMLEQDDLSPPTADGKDERAVVPLVTRSLRLFAFQWPVHRLSIDWVPAEPEPVILACYRTPQDQIDFMELTPASGALLEQMSSEPLPIGDQIERLAERLGAEPAAIDGFTRQFIQELEERHIIVPGHIAGT